MKAEGVRDGRDCIEGRGRVGRGEKKRGECKRGGVVPEPAIYSCCASGQGAVSVDDSPGGPV